MGKGIVEELAAYIHQNEPNASGFSASNLWRMKQFYETYCGKEKLATDLREIAPKAQEVFRDTCVMKVMPQVLDSRTKLEEMNERLESGFTRFWP